MTAHEAKKACATEGLTIYVEIDDVMLTDHTISAVQIRYNECLITVSARDWPLAVAAFKGWRDEWQKDGAK